MKRFDLLTLDRKTGTETPERVVAADERAAFAMIAERGRVVAKVVHVEDLGKPTPGVPTPPPPPSARPRPPAARAVIPRGDMLGMTVAAWLLIAAGVGTVLFGLGTNTTTLSGLDRVHNVGLLNDRLVTVIIGSAMFISGVLIGSARAVVAAVQGAARRLESPKQ
jgi:hypothetical protein